MSETVIRLALQDDAALLPDIERSAGAAFRSVPGLEWIADDDVMSADHHQIYIDEGTVWVALLQKQLIGFVTTAIHDDALHIMELAVVDGHQGLGIGSSLMDKAKEYATKNKFPALTLTTFRDLAFNESFYHKLGYQTLEYGKLTPRLRDILQAEKANGLPAERRCAMRLEI